MEKKEKKKKISDIYVVIELVNDKPSTGPFLTLSKEEIENYILSRKKKHSIHDESELEIDFNKLNSFGICVVEITKLSKENICTFLKWKIYSKKVLDNIPIEKIVDDDDDDDVFLDYKGITYKLALFINNYVDDDNVQLGIGLCNKQDTKEKYEILHKIAISSLETGQKNIFLSTSHDYYAVYSQLLMKNIFYDLFPYDVSPLDTMSKQLKYGLNKKKIKKIIGYSEIKEKL